MILPALLLLAGLTWTINQFLKAPHGWQDENGFHEYNEQDTENEAAALDAGGAGLDVYEAGNAR